MSLSAYDEKLISPVGDGGGKHLYDFETFYTSLDKYPFREKGSTENSSGLIIQPNSITSYIHEVIHFYQHIGTTIGEYLAICRQYRLNFGISGVDYADKNLLYKKVFPDGKTRQPLIRRKEMRELYNLEHDPLYPDHENSFRTLYYEVFVGQMAMLRVSAFTDIDTDFRQGFYRALLIANSFRAKHTRQEQDTESLYLSIEQVFKHDFNPVNYFGRRLDTEVLLESFCSAWEIYMLCTVSNDLASLRMQSAESDNYLVAVRYILDMLQKDFLPYNIYRFIPEISILIELALNPPINEIVLHNKPLSWKELYPPLRLSELVKASRKIGNYLEVDKLDTRSLEERARELVHVSGVPTQFVRELKSPSKLIQQLTEVMSRDFHPDDKKIPMGQIKWIDWYYWFRNRFLQRNGGLVFITDTIVNDILKDNLGWEPPVGIDSEANHYVADYMTRNSHIAHLFELENLQSYMIHDIYLGSGDIKPYPFDITEDHLAKWKVLEKGHYQHLVDKRLGIM